MSLVDFEHAVKYVLDREGGLVNNPADPGGITNRGITIRFLKSLSLENLKKYKINTDFLEDSLINLTEEQAKSIYRGEFWTHAPFESLLSQDVVNYLFDMAINLGIAPAIKCAQRSCWCILGDRRSLKDDGIMGNKTIDAINHCRFYLLPVLKSERAAYYKSIAEKNPAQAEFLEGWLSRTY